jgi:hypothetical protein
LKIIHIFKTGLKSLKTSSTTNGPCFVIDKDTQCTFAFVSPPQCKIKERMIYAAAKQNVLNMAEKTVGKVKSIEGFSL